MAAPALAAHHHEPGHRHVHGSDDERIVPGTAIWEVHFPEHRQRYEFAAAHMPLGANVLDAGCGVGYGSAILADRGAASVVAVDLAGEALAIARASFSRPGIRWVHEDCQALADAGADAPFDLVVNLENIEHLPDAEVFLRRVVTLLRPGGTFVVSTPDRAGMARLRGLPLDLAPANPHHTREFTTPEFVTLLERHFDSVVPSWQSYDPIERMHYEPVLAALWHNPLARVGRWLQRVVRRRPVARTFEEILPPKAYQLLEQDPGPGLAITVLAVCRGPRRPGPSRI